MRVRMNSWWDGAGGPGVSATSNASCDLPVDESESHAFHRKLEEETILIILTTAYFVAV